VYEHGEPSKGFPMVDLSLEGEDVAPDTSQDEEITRKLFVDLNHSLLGPLDDGHIIIFSDSEEEEEVREDDGTDAEAAPSFARNSQAPTASADDDDDAPDKGQDDSSDGGDEVGTP
jgi:hypothetical protein